MKSRVCFCRQWLFPILMLFSVQCFSLPDQSWHLVGKARFSFLWFKVYDARLLTPDGHYIDGQRPVRFEINYHLPVTSQQLVQLTHKEWGKQNLFHPAQAGWLEDLMFIWPEIQSGDTLVLEINAAGHSVFFYNGMALGTMENTDFGSHFLAIWLSEKSSNLLQRQQLLGY
ncbi:hypothetical protein CI610_02198 [invertebrate metagenome]|uniref:Chalcone isomerase domain-containing protein n=1 Tax=invertebrate metagenome TaxID=1711999 RepID=A0A2H9T6K3_9ZZZZ